MKKLFSLLAFVATISINAQAPQGFNYQAIVRNNSGQLLVNQIVLVKFNILQNSATGDIVYSETQTANTDDLGHIALVVGQGTATTGTFSNINWGTGSYYLGIELNTGSGFVAMGTTQLLSVPYALYALNSGTSKTLGKPTILITGNITNEQAAAQIATELGSQTDNIWVMDTTILSTLDLSAAIGLTSLKIENNKNLSNVNLNGLSSTYDVVSIGTNPALTSLSFPAYTRSSGYKLGIYDNASLTSISFPVLLNLSCRAAYISGNSKLTTIGLPSLASLYTSNLFGGFCQSFNSNALPSSQINTLLNKLLSVAPATGKNIDLSSQTPAAPPTGQGVIDKATLINAGNNVTTDIFTPTLTPTLTITTRCSALSGGNITSDGGGYVTARGVCWSTSPNPTVESNTVTVDGAGIDVFSSFLSALNPATTYYVRAYATNAAGTSYGNEIIFTTKFGFEGAYKVIQGEYWRINSLSTSIVWTGQTRTIESVNSTTYKILDFAGPFIGNTHYFNIDASNNVKTPTLYNGIAQLLNGYPLSNCDETPSLIMNACGFSGIQNIVVRDNVNGIDKIYRTYGYNTPTGPREFYEVLERIVN